MDRTTNMIVVMASSETTCACWLGCAGLAMENLALSALCVVPRLEARHGAAVIVSGMWCLIFAGLAVYAHSRPKEHWIHRSKKVSAYLVLIAVLVGLGAGFLLFRGAAR